MLRRPRRCPQPLLPRWRRQHGDGADGDGTVATNAEPKAAVMATPCTKVAKAADSVQPAVILLLLLSMSINVNRQSMSSVAAAPKPEGPAAVMPAPTPAPDAAPPSTYLSALVRIPHDALPCPILPDAALPGGRPATCTCSPPSFGCSAHASPAQDCRATARESGRLELDPQVQSAATIEAASRDDRPPDRWEQGPRVRVNHDPTRAIHPCMCPVCARVSPGAPAVWDSRPPTWCALPRRGWGLACCAPS